MTGYANKFTISLGDVARISFQDERPPAAPGLPASVLLTAEVVLTLNNFIALRDLMTQLLDEHKKNNPNAR